MIENPNDTKKRNVLLLTRQFIHFSGFGLIGTAMQYIVLLILVELARMDAVIASSIGFAFGAVINYYLNYRFTFQSQNRHIEALPKFLSIAGVGLIWNVILMLILVRSLGIYYAAAQVVSTGLVLFWNFFANRAWTFKSNI